MIRNFDEIAYKEIRNPIAKTSFGFIDVNANANATITTTALTPYSNKDQILNDITDMSLKIATLEADYWRGDGSFTLPLESMPKDIEVGIWFDIISNEDGYFAENPYHIISLANGYYSSPGLQLFFDNAAAVYPSDFVIRVYRDSLLLATDIVTNNDDVMYLYNKGIDNYNRVEVEFTRTAEPYRRIRVVESPFGSLEVFNPDKIVRLNILQETDLTSETLPAVELIVTVENTDKRFDIFNPEGSFRFLTRKQKLTPYIGFLDDKEEYVQVGNYYLYKWTSETGGITTTLNGYDATMLLDDGVYRKSVIKTDTAANLIREVMQDAGFEMYRISQELESVTLTGYIPVVSHREAIRTILEAARAVKVSDYNGNLLFKQLDSEVVGSLNFDNMYDVPKVDLNEYVSKISVAALGLTVDEGRSVLYEKNLEGTGTYTLQIDYSNAPATGVSASVTSGTLVNAIYYACSCILTVTGTANTIVRARGTSYTTTSEYFTVINGDEQGTEKEIVNSLIGDLKTAEAVALWKRQEYNRRLRLSITERGNPAKEIGDHISIEDTFGRQQETVVTKQEFEYDSTLKADIEVRGYQNADI